MEKTPSVEGRVYGDTATKFHDFRLYRLHTLLAGDGDAVVAVADEVGVPDLVQAHRRKLLGPEHGLIYLLPTPLDICRAPAN